MEHGIIELNKLLNKFENMSISEYLELYNKSLSLESINILDSFINTEISYVFNQNVNDINFFADYCSDIIIDKSKDNIFSLKSDSSKAA